MAFPTGVIGTYSPYDFWSSVIDTSKSPDLFEQLGLNSVTGTGTFQDTRLKADLEATNAKAKTSGNANLEKWTSFILRVGDSALSILTKNGIIRNKNLQTAQYDLSGLDLDSDTSTTSNATSGNTSTNNAAGFNIDFTSPTTLLIVFVVLMLLFYFLFFNPKTAKNGSR